MLHRFETSKGTLRLWQQRGESYEHVLMKALAYAMNVGEFPSLEIEKKVGLRYKPDLIAIGRDGRFEFWGECGLISVRKTVWLAKHSRAKRVTLFKINYGIEQFLEQLRSEIEPKYREGRRLRVVNFVGDIKDLTAHGQIAKVSADWYTETII